jgi:PleD family two-component response regulator
MARADDTPENLYKRADKLLYAAKESGRNRLVLDS